MHGKFKIWLPKSTVITVNSYIVHCSYISTLWGNFSIIIPMSQTAKQTECHHGWTRKTTQSSGCLPSPCCILVLVKAAVKIKHCPANHWCRNIYGAQFSVSQCIAIDFIIVTFAYTPSNYSWKARSVPWQQCGAVQWRAWGRKERWLWESRNPVCSREENGLQHHTQPQPVGSKWL